MDVRTIELPLEHFDQGYIFPSQLWRVDHDPGLTIDHSGKYDPNAAARRRRELRHTRFLDGLADLDTDGRNKRHRIELCRETYYLADLLADSIGDHQET